MSVGTIVLLAAAAVLFLLYLGRRRSRLNSEEDNWFGRREDLLRRSASGLKLARRHIYLDQTIILAQNMSSLF